MQVVLEDREDQGVLADKRTAWAERPDREDREDRGIRVVLEVRVGNPLLDTRQQVADSIPELMAVSGRRLEEVEAVGRTLGEGVERTRGEAMGCTLEEVVERTLEECACKSCAVVRRRGWYASAAS